MSPKKVAKPLDIYVRVSDVRGRVGESFISPREQEERCRAALASRGLEVGKVFKELDVSGKSMERPELTKVLGRIDSGTSGGVVVAKIDRFGRTVVGALETIERIDKAGGVIVTAEGDFDTSTAVGELVLGIMLQLAQFELRRIKDNWSAAQRRAIERGVYISANVPPGYERGEDGVLVSHPKHGPTISEAFRMAAAGQSPAEIARFLTERELPSGNKGRTVWRSSRIKRLLANRAYRGQARYGDYVNDDAHEALVDETTFLRAQRDKRASSAASESPYLLTGLVRCASCRFAMRPQKARGKTIATYRCATETTSARCEHPSSISMQRLDELVLDQFLLRPLFSEPVLRAEQEDDAVAQAALAEAQRELEEVKALEGELRPAVFAQALDSALDKLEEAQQAVASGQTFDDQDVALLANAVMPLLAGRYTTFLREDGQHELVKLEEPEPEKFKKLDSVGLKTIRDALARDIQAVFVRPAASRSKTLPTEDRVKIVWSDEEPLELPQRGERFEPQPYEWEAA